MRYVLGNYDLKLISKAAVVILTGNDETVVFCSTLADLLRQANSAQGDLWTCESLADFEQRARAPAFFGRWWYSGSADRLSAADMKALDRLLKKPVEYGTAVLTGVDFMKYRLVTRGSKASPYVHEIATSFPNSKYLIKHLQREVILRGSKISQKASDAFIWRLGDSYSKYEYYIDLMIAELPTGDTEVTTDHVVQTLKGVQGASFDVFLKYLMKPMTNGNLKRSTKLFRVYPAMLDDGAASTLRKLHKKALQYLELRRLINEGYIPVGVAFTTAALAKLLGIKEAEPDEAVKVERSKKPGTSMFTVKDVLQWSDLKLKREVEVAAQAPLADWYAIVRLSGNVYATDLEAERVLFGILTRSRIENISLD